MHHLFQFEHRRDALASRERFSSRLLRNGLWAAAVTLLWLAAGTVGYALLEGMPVLDAYLNAAMILSGMGPMGELHNAAAKIFAGLYAIVSGLLIFGIAGVALAPVFHRVLHRFHIEDQADREP